MKSKFVTILALCVIASSATLSLTQAQAQSRNIQRNVYASECSYPAPLYTYDRCNEHSYIGRQAADCAMEEAMDACEGDFNSDCVKISAKVWEESVPNFPGYKVCKAKARVHGYEPK